MKTTKRDRGFSLIEVLVGLALLAIAVLGLAQLFVARHCHLKGMTRIV